MPALVREKEWVDKQYEVRLTVVDKQFFPCRIDTGSGAAALDWRADYDSLTYTALPEIPTQVRTGVVALMSRLQLRFATMDFIVTPNDQWAFVDLNANGQWAWIQDATGQPISVAIADALQQG